MNTLPLQITGGLLLQYAAADDIAFVCSGSTATVANMVMNAQFTLIHQWIITSKMR